MVSNCRGFWFASLAGCLAASAAGAADIDGKKYLILHADDAGMSHSVNVGTIEGMEKGAVSSASIMVPCAWLPEIAAYAKANPERDFGIHLTLNSEWELYRWGPVAPRDQVPSLLDKDGYLPRGVAEVAARVKAEEVAVELRAQVQRALDFGIPVTHLDTHMGALVSRPDLVEVYVHTGLEFNLPVLFLRHVDENTAKAYPALAERAAELVRMLDDRRLPVLDRLYQTYSTPSEEARRAGYLKILRELKPGINELIIHCGVDNEELRAITTSSGGRDADRRIFIDPEIMREIKQQNIELVGWKQMHELIKRDAAQ
ncbi:MAG: polysaccharide deacetylase family protein [Planctomycetaceae bacterium]